MHLKQMSLNRGGFMRLTKKGEHIERQEVSADQVAAYLLSREKLIAWIRTNCDVVPWPPSLATKREERKELQEIIGQESFDTILAAAVPDRALFSDDLRLRQIAKAEFDVQGIATQPILAIAVDRGIISRERYNQAIIQLASAGYLRTFLDPAILLDAAKQAEWMPGPPFSSVVWLLTGEHCGEHYAVRLAADFIRQMWLQPILPRSTDYLVFHLLDNLAKNRDAMQVSEKLLVALSQALALIPIAEAEMSKMIHAWRALRMG